jgi:chorismate synthase
LKSGTEGGDIMKNTFGNNVHITLFGESHGPSVGVVIDGLAPGLPVDEAVISAMLARRGPRGEIATARHEEDRFEIESGVFNGKTTGTPVCIRIPNEDLCSTDYTVGDRLARPGHADVAAHYKYQGYEDYRGGGHFSGRITAALAAAAGIVIPALEKKGIHIGTHIRCLDGVKDCDFANVAEDISLLHTDFPVLDLEVRAQMMERILQAKAAGDSVGGVLETAVVGVPAGVGEPWFDTMEGMLAHVLFSIPAVKGVEFGDGFALADMHGSEANDAWRIGDAPYTTTNHNGGINGGITNGMPLIFRCAVKPTPSIGQEQDSISLATGLEQKIVINGRHDPCIVPRAVPVIEAAAAVAIYDMILGNTQAKKRG